MNRPRFHPVCLLFPQLGKQELEELADDIRENGLLNEIVTLDGKILDGRNRLAACRIAKVKPRFKEFDGDDAIAWMISQNLVRRHLTASQRAVVAFGLLPILEADAKRRQRQSNSYRGNGRLAKELANRAVGGKASQIAARLAKTNSAYVESVKAISKQAPELIDEIKAGTITVPEANDLAKLPKRQRSTVLQRAGNGNGKLTRVIRQAELDHRQRSLQRAARNGSPLPHGKIDIWCGDCLSLMPERIRSKSVDVVVTSRRPTTSALQLWQLRRQPG